MNWHCKSCPAYKNGKCTDTFLDIICVPRMDNTLENQQTLEKKKHE
jgi:hypothetical protein